MDELHYLEKKGFINPVRAKLKQRTVRQYPETDVRKLQLTIKYRREGFTWDVAFQKALQELQNPRLFDVR